MTTNAEVKQIIANILAKQPEINSVYFVGCGASRSDLYVGYFFLNQNAKKIRTSLHTANEFVYATPAAVDEHAIVITCSLGGSTPETAKATTVAKQRGAHTIALTHTLGSAITKDADQVVEFGWQGENASAKVDKEVKALLLAAEILNQVEGYEYYDKMIAAADAILPAIDKAVSFVAPEAKKFAEEYKDAPIIYVTSSGATQEMAWSFAACLMMEMQWIPASTFNDGDFFHGPFEMVDKDVPYLLLMNDGSTRPMDARAMTFMQRFDAKVTVCDAKDLGLANAVASEVIDYFNPIIISPVIREYAEQLAIVRNHSLSKRRYMWKLEY